MNAEAARRLLAAAGIAVAMIAVAAGAEDEQSKRDVARELLRLSNSGEMGKQLADLASFSMQQQYGAMVNEFLSAQSDLKPEDRARVEEHLSNYEHFGVSFASRVSEKIDFAGTVEEVYIPLYTENFTEPELREMLAFQRSPVGMKSARLLPQLMQQGLAETIPRLQPEVMAVAEEVLREQQAVALEKAP